MPTCSRALRQHLAHRALEVREVGEDPQHVQCEDECHQVPDREHDELQHPGRRRGSRPRGTRRRAPRPAAAPAARSRAWPAGSCGGTSGSSRPSWSPTARVTRRMAVKFSAVSAAPIVTIGIAVDDEHQVEDHQVGDPGQEPHGRGVPVRRSRSCRTSCSERSGGPSSARTRPTDLTVSDSAANYLAQASRSAWIEARDVLVAGVLQRLAHLGDGCCRVVELAVLAAAGCTARARPAHGREASGRSRPC